MEALTETTLLVNTQNNGTTTTSYYLTSNADTTLDTTNLLSTTISDLSTTITTSLYEETFDTTTNFATENAIHSTTIPIIDSLINITNISTVGILVNNSNQSTLDTEVNYEYYEYDDPGIVLQTTAQTFVGFILFAFCALTITGNLLTIMSFIRDPKLRTVQNTFILNLATTDLFIGISSIPFYAIYTILNFDWIFGYTFCKIWNLVDFWVCAESSLTIILISHDRLQMVMQGAQYSISQTHTKAILKITATWVLSFLIYGPAIIGYNHWRGYTIVEDHDCDTEFAEEFIYTTATAFIEFCIPFVLLITFNSLLYWNIRERSIKIEMNKKKINGEGKRNKVSAISDNTQDEKTAHAPSNASQAISAKKVKDRKVLRKDIKAAKSLAVLVVTYAICWLPYTMLTIFISFFPDSISDIVYEPTTWLLWLNSALNPILYALTNQQFKKNFSEMLCRCNWLCCYNWKESVKSGASSNSATNTRITSCAD